MSISRTSTAAIAMKISGEEITPSTEQLAVLDVFERENDTDYEKENQMIKENFYLPSDEVLVNDLEKFTSELNQLVKKNQDKEVPDNIFKARAESLKYLPTIESYIKRFFQSVDCSYEEFIGMLIYLERYANTGIPINHHNIHRLMLVSFIFAIKLLSEYPTKNSFYAKVGGISTENLFDLEFEFLAAINVDLNITPEQFKAVSDKLNIRYDEAQRDMDVSETEDKNPFHRIRWVRNYYQINFIAAKHGKEYESGYSQTKSRPTYSPC